MKKSSHRVSGDVLNRSREDFSPARFRDRQLQADLLQTAIEWQGYKAVLAENCAEGLAICSIQSDIVAIVCDMEMRVMGGLAFTEKIGRLKAKARVIVSTGGDEANLARAKTFKVVRATLPKPYSIPDFWATLERVLCGEA